MNREVFFVVFESNLFYSDCKHGIIYVTFILIRGEIMRQTDEVLDKYLELFGEEKDYLSVLRECHEKVTQANNTTFNLVDFKEDIKYQEYLLLIEEYRKYAVLDDFIMQAGTTALATQQDIGDFRNEITYHNIVEALSIYETNFDNSVKFYIRKDLASIAPTLNVIEVLTVNDIFTNHMSNQFKVYKVESENKQYFSMLHEGYEFVYSLPFVDIDLQSNEDRTLVALGYLYLLQEYVQKHFNDIPKDKEFTTLARTFGVSYEHYLKSQGSGKHVVYLENLKPFLIETPDITYYPHLNELSFGVVDIMGDKKEQHKDFFTYFQTLELDKEKVLSYVKENWIRNQDIGKVYDISYNYVATKEEIETYKENIVKKKTHDIQLNFDMYVKYGLSTYDSSTQNSTVPETGYKPYIQEYLSLHDTARKFYGKEGDKRIDLDSSTIFYLSNGRTPETLANISENELGVLGEEQSTKNITFAVNIVEFIKAYNEYAGEEALSIDYEWYFPMKQLEHYIDNTVQSFCQRYLVSGVREEEFCVLRDVFYYEGEDKTKIMEHPNFIEDHKKHLLSSYNKFFFRIPFKVNIFMDSKDFKKLEKGTHPIFKSALLESLYEEEQLKLSSQPRFLSKKEISENKDVDVVYTGATHKSCGLYKGLKGKVVSINGKIQIIDELGNIHEETFQSVKKSGWQHLSTIPYDSVYNKLSLQEKAFLENNRGTLKLE